MKTYKYNGEHYYDPTASAALSKIEQEGSIPYRRPLVFVSSPYAGDMKRNTSNARRYARFAVDQGAIPLPPHLLYPQILDENIPEERDLGLQFGLALLKKCDEIWLFGEVLSMGMARELEAAKQHKMRIRYFTDRCKEVPSCRMFFRKT